MGKRLERLTGALTAVLIAMPSIGYAQSLAVPITSGKNPYDIAKEYCSDREGVAHYLPKSDSVSFSCGNAPADMIVISK